MGRYLAALHPGDTRAIVDTFTSQGYLRAPIEAHRHRGAHELRAYFDRSLSAGGCVGLQPVVQWLSVSPEWKPS